MPKWNVTIPDRTDRLVRVFLARTGMKKGDLSSFVGEAVLAEVVRRTAAHLQERDPELSAEGAAELAENLAAIEIGMDDVRAGRGEPMREALAGIAEELGLKLDR